MKKKAEQFLPLNYTALCILLSLKEPLHGNGIMREIGLMNRGGFILAPGTLYGALSKLEKDGLIFRQKEETNERRKMYELTVLGKQVLLTEFTRLENLVEANASYMEALRYEKTGPGG